MEKKLKRTEYVYSLLFIFVLVCALGAFFYGVQIGTDRAEAKYNQILEDKKEPSKFAAYDQQYLVSFYHTIFSPYRDFQKKWFEYTDDIELQRKSVDPASLFKELSKLADEHYSMLEKASMPNTSPLLQKAQTNYMKSLKLFSDASNQFKSKVASLSGRAILNQINEDAYFQEAEQFGLQAQNQYFHSIVQWNLMTNKQLAGTALVTKQDLTFKEWNGLSLNVKNNFITALLYSQKMYKPFYPHDLTQRVDELIKNGNASILKLTTIKQVVETLMDTAAVRSGDYIKGKNKYYENEKLPQLPFFFE